MACQFYVFRVFFSEGTLPPNCGNILYQLFHIENVAVAREVACDERVARHAGRRKFPRRFRESRDSARGYTKAGREDARRCGASTEAVDLTTKYRV
jgi:hypothetical protein